MWIKNFRQLKKMNFGSPRTTSLQFIIIICSNSGLNPVFLRPPDDWASQRAPSQCNCPCMSVKRKYSKRNWKVKRDAFSRKCLLNEYQRIEVFGFVLSRTPRATTQKERLALSVQEVERSSFVLYPSRYAFAICFALNGRTSGLGPNL